LAGGFRDPLVGRDILIGAFCGVVMILNNYLIDLVPKWLGWPPNKPFIDGQLLLGIRYFFTDLNNLFTSTLFVSFSFLFLLLFLFIILRRKWLAALAGWLVYASLLTMLLSDRAITLPFAITASLITVGVLYRYGLLAMISAMFFFHAWVFLPITSDLSAWYAGDFALALVIYVALALYSFYISLAGQPLFRGKLLED
jgi:serine/threonine-protein kinase